MSVGESIKIHRSKAGLTQKDLSEKLNVSFQTVSKWENDTNEPDLSTLRAMCEIFGCTIDELINENNEDNNEVTKSPFSNQIKCDDCEEVILSEYHPIKRKGNNGEVIDVKLCDECYKKFQEEQDKEAKEIYASFPTEKEVKKTEFHRTGKKAIVWGSIAGILTFITLLVVCIVNVKVVGVGLTIFLPILGGYTMLATIYCLVRSSFISDVFIEVASWSIKMPGVIFSFSADGLKFLIFMKIFLAILSLAVTVGVIVLAFVICGFLSFFAFIPILVHNKNKQ